MSECVCVCACVRESGARGPMGAVLHLCTESPLEALPQVQALDHLRGYLGFRRSTDCTLFPYGSF